jgi:hypothetical protein
MQMTPLDRLHILGRVGPVIAVGDVVAGAAEGVSGSCGDAG